MRAIAAVMAASLLLGAGAAPPRFSLEAMQRIVDVSGAVISPDGTYIAYVTTRNVLERNARVDTLHVYNLRSRADRSAPFRHESYSNLQWAENGRLAYVADDAAANADELFVTDGALASERRLTSGTDVLEESWSHDGRRLAFLRHDPEPAKNGADKYRDAFEVTDNAYLSTRNPKPVHLWVVTLDGRERRLTSGTWSVRDASVSWSSGDGEILYERVPNAIYGIRDRSKAEFVDVASGRSVAADARSSFENQAVYSPAGSSVAMLYPQDGTPQGEPAVWLSDRAGAAPHDVTRALDRHVEDFAWYDNSHVLVRAYDGTQVRLYLAGLHGRILPLPAGDVKDASIDSLQSADAQGDIAFTGSTSMRPPELYYLPRGARAPEKLTAFNDWIAGFDLARETEIRWKNGPFTEYGVLTYPPAYDPHRKYPLAIRIHGGPALSALTAFDPFYQAAAARGYVVLAPNYRGSSNEGNAFERAIYNDASEGPGTDVMASIEAVKRLGIIDANRIGVSGWSYGGQLTSWLTAKYHVWKAAVAGAGVHDLVLDYSIADDYDDDLHAFSAPPVASLNQWRRQSPMTYVDAITTPTLILGNVYDVRVPIAESYELYHALRDRGVPVKFYAYPTTGHLPSGPVRLADAYGKWLDWFDAHLNP